MGNSSGAYRILSGSELGIRPGAKAVGSADPAGKVRVSVVVRRRPGAPPLPDPLKGGRFLSRGELAERFGAAEEDLARVVSFGREHGLVEVERSVARRMVVLSGTAEQAGRAFAAELRMYRSQAETYRGHEGPVSVPADLAPVVEGVFGLDNRRMAARGGVLAPPPRPVDPAMAGAGAGPAATVTPLQVAEFYGLTYPNDYSGGSIGILEFTGGDGDPAGFLQSDIDAFFQNLQLPPPVPATLFLGGAFNDTSTKFSQEFAEATADIDVAGSVAPGAAITVYFAPWTVSGWIEALSTAIHDHVNAPTVLSISYGWAEFEPTFNDPVQAFQSWSAVAMYIVSSFLAEAAIMGLTVFAASGDGGAGDNISGTAAHVSYPASDPNVLAVGGSELAGLGGPSPTEQVWLQPGGATGGGVSDQWPVPSWQQGAGVPPSANNNGRIGRGIPDIAGFASLSSGAGYDIVFKGKTTNWGAGTSVAAPLYAGMFAQFNPDNAILVQPFPLIGLLNPTVYSPVFRTALNNIYGPVNNGGLHNPGYEATKGWNACTGWGSVQIDTFIDLFYSPGVGAASQHFGVPDQTDVYLVNSNGILCSYSAVGEGPWTAPDLISVPKFAPPGAGLAASQQFGWPDQTDVFVVGSDGTLNVFWASGAGGWNGPQPISAQGFAPPGSYIAASQHYGVPDQTDVFVIGSDGALSVFWVDGYGTWYGPVALSQPGFAPPGAPLAACQLMSGRSRTAVFTVGSDGALHATWAEGAGPWPPPQPVSAAGLFPPLAGVAAVPVYGGTAVFAVGTDQKLAEYLLDAGPVLAGRPGGWQASTVSDTVLFPPGAPPCASPRYGTDGTFVIAAATDYSLNAFTSDRGGPWSAAQQIGAQTTGTPVDYNWIVPGWRVVASQRFGVEYPQTSAFIVSSENLWVTTTGQTVDWSPASVVGPAGASAGYLP